MNRSGIPGAVVFDFDGLVLDTERTSYQATQEVFSEHGEEFSAQYWASMVGLTDHPHWTTILEEQLGHGIDREKWVQHKSARSWELASELELMPGVLALFEALRAVGVPMAVASASRARWAEGHLHQRGLDHYFTSIRGREHTERTKPHPDPYLSACAALGVEPSAAIAIEDSVPGVASAKSAGLTVVAVPGGMTADHDYVLADLIVLSCADLTVGDLAHLQTRHGSIGGSAS